jgi:glycosyltransferase involved in cell wall biosynthesis
MKHLVSVLVPTYNRKWLLPRTLQSLINQSYENIEILLVNDAGEDVQDVVDNLNDPRIKYFQNEKNKGLAGTRNVALKNSTGDYICLLDDDDIYLTYAIEFRLYMMQKLQAEIVYSRTLLDTWERNGSAYHSVGKKLYWDMEFNRDRILVYNIAPCCCPLFSRKAWEKSNYWFDETMTTTEDHDFWMALSRNYDFKNLELVDAECSQRTDKSQMTGSLNFVPNWIKSFQHWRHTAEDKNWVINEQNNVLRSVGINPADYNL